MHIMLLLILNVRLFWAITCSSCLGGTMELRLRYSRVPKPGGLVRVRVGVIGGVPMLKCLASGFWVPMGTLGLGVARC